MNSEYEIPSNLELKSTTYLELAENKKASVNTLKSKGRLSQKSRKLKSDSDQYYTVNDE